MGHANVRYYLDGNKQPPLHPKPVDKMTAIQKSVYELEHVAPRVMYVPNPTIVADRAAAMKALPAIVPGTGAVLEGPAPPPAADTATVVAGTITSESANALTVEITTPGPGVVVVAEAYFPAWTATVNGETAVIHPANGMFRGFVVPAAGTYRIEMKLRPFRFYALLPGYFAAFGLFMWFVIGRVRLRIRARRTGD